jgi:hypothetical protein
MIERRKPAAAAADDAADEIPEQRVEAPATVAIDTTRPATA